MTRVLTAIVPRVGDPEFIGRKDFVEKEIREEFDPDEVQNEFTAVQGTFFKYTGCAVGVGAVAATAVPFLVGKNELNDYNLLKYGKEKGVAANKDSLNELLYRSVSI